MSGSSADTVSTTTRMQGARSLSRRIASMPGTPGMLRSMITTSGQHSATQSIAAAAFGTSATTSIPFARSWLARPAR